MLSRFECIAHTSSVSLEVIKLIAVVNSIFYLSDFLISFMIFFKYGFLSNFIKIFFN